MYDELADLWMEVCPCDACLSFKDCQKDKTACMDFLYFLNHGEYRLKWRAASTDIYNQIYGDHA